MTTEFRIDRPGVYRTRNGRTVPVWPAMRADEVYALDHGINEVYLTDGAYFPDRASEYDIVEYVGPLPADILQRMTDALAAAEYQPQAATPATFREALNTQK